MQLHRNSEISLVNIEPFLTTHVPERVVTTDGTMQLWTHRDDSDSMFMALFGRK